MSFEIKSFINIQKGVLNKDMSLNERETTVSQNTNEYQFVERDISWLSFNGRVLQEAADPSVPLYERIKFLAIFSNNLDEFFRVRISALRSFKKLNKSTRKLLESEPKKILNQIRGIVDDQQQEFGNIYQRDIVPELKDNNIELLELNQFSEEDLKFAHNFYKDNLVDHLEVQYIESHQTDCFLEDNELYFAVRLVGLRTRFAIVNIPVNEVGRFVKLPPKPGKLRVTFLDEIIKAVLQQMIPGYRDSYSIKISRDAEMYIGDEFDGDLVEKIKKGLDDRDIGLPTRFLFDHSIPYDFLKLLQAHFKINLNDAIPGARHHNFNDFFKFPKPENAEHLFYKEMPPLNVKQWDEAKELIPFIEEKDRMLHFPYQKYEYVTQLIKEAVQREDVAHIRMTLYRVASDSKVLHALIDALKAGKAVTVFIEAKARFDEKTNLRWGGELKKAGATVLYSYPGIKVHAKLLFIEFKEETNKTPISYLGTGNFNEVTSKIYCDHALFTVNAEIARDIKQVFLVLERQIIIPNPIHLLISPFTLRSDFHAKIDREIKNALRGKKAYMFIKMNSLEDKRIIRKLYEASNAGVKIKLIIRGICSVVPGILGMSENIKVLSVIDRFLEHARLYVFCNGGKEEMYMASADWMNRNLDRRIEVAVPILDKDIYREMKEFLDMQWEDNTKARIIDEFQLNRYVQRKKNERKKRAQYDMYSYLEKKYSTS